MFNAPSGSSILCSSLISWKTFTDGPHFGYLLVLLVATSSALFQTQKSDKGSELWDGK